MNFIKVLTISILLIFTMSGITLSQDFVITVTLNTDQLNIDGKDRVKDLKQQIEDYFNKNKFADVDFGEVYKIKASLQINFTGSNGFDSYNAQMFFAGQRIVDDKAKYQNPPGYQYTTTFRFLDERCAFTYNRSMPFMKNDVRFDPLLSLLDFYAYVILGFDEDSYFPKGGNRYFQKALDVCNKPMSDRNGWTEGGGGKPTRVQLMQEMLNSRFDDFRQGFWEYYWMGIDSISTSKNAYKYILSAIEKMYNVKKKEVKAYNIDLFFEAKATEIAEKFLLYGDKSVYDKLTKFDPAHQRIYEDYKAKAR